ncbi:hypothetical protein SHKM778_83180 [Streptomyces sp. KM77-8]|uniref:Uncharacterized protein n=1 Tax=Streptomyces haneummycinicus TaxID=3074435 RepID=A0AAT9HX32_9ACTN
MVPVRTDGRSRRPGFQLPGPNSGPSFLQQPQTPAPPYPPQAEFFYPDNPVTTQEEYQNLYATPADVLESPTFQEVDFPTPTMAGASFLQSGYDQGAAEPGDLTAQQEAVDPQLDQYRAAYAEWVGISVKQRPVPTAEVLAGYANRTNRSVNSGFIPYFEAAHGIPIGSLSRDVNSKKFEVLTRGAWQPETHTGTSYLSAEQMNALRDIGDPQVKPEQAYAIWQSLPVDQRVPPKGRYLPAGPAKHR